MNTQSNTIRELTNEECESTSGGLWFAVAVLVGAAAAGSLLAVCTTEREEEVLVPDIQFPS
jgi:lactobin A/cerein 7B family class IIb bacteriocin